MQLVNPNLPKRTKIAAYTLFGLGLAGTLVLGGLSIHSSIVDFRAAVQHPDGGLEEVRDVTTRYFE